MHDRNHPKLSPAGAARREIPLPTLRTPLSPEAVLERLDRLSKRGKLPGFARVQQLRGPGTPSGAAFRVLVFGSPYDQELIAALAPEPAASGPASGPGATALSFRLRLLRKTPTIMIGTIVLTLFPGLPLTDTMLKAYFDWYRIETWWWYVPLTVLTLPFMWRQFTASKRASRAEADQVIAKIAKELDATPV